MTERKQRRYERVRWRYTETEKERKIMRELHTIESRKKVEEKEVKI